MYNIVQLLHIIFMLSPSFMGRADNLHERIAKVAESMLSDRYAQSIATLEVRVMRTGGEIEHTGLLELTWPNQPEIPRALLRVEVRSKDALANESIGWALLYVAHYDSVLVLNRSIKNDERVLDSYLSTVWTETTRFHGAPLTSLYYRQLTASGDVFANRYIKENRVLKESDLRNAFDVETGQQVIMTYIRDGITLELSCKSRNRGYIGDIIKLYSSDTKHMYKARITGPQTAIWAETLQ